MKKHDMRQVLTRISNMETMSWREVEQRTGSHLVSVDQIIPDARERLCQRKLDDLSDLFSLRVTAKERIWGVRRGSVLHLLWWDPEHQICPSIKRHT